MSRPLPLQTQLMLLSAAVVAAVLAVAFAAVSWVPVPPMPPMTLADAVAALAHPDLAAERGLERQRQPQLPVGSPAPEVVAAAASLRPGTTAALQARWLNGGSLGGSVPPVKVVAADAAAQAPSSAQLATVVQRVLSRPALQLPPFALAEQQSDGTWLVVMPPDPLGSVWRYRVLLALALGSAITLPLAAYVARQIAQPVRALANAATQADLAGSGPPLAVTGPREIDAAATAFNAMRRRLADQAAERTRMVAAVAHDLRTPLTGLRLRAEQVDEPLRGRMVADIDRMRSMIDDVLEFARSQQAPLASATFDLAALARECAMLASEIGPAVSCRAPVAASCVGDEPAVRRAPINLIDNAQRYAGAAEVAVRRVGPTWSIEVADRGPGLDAAECQRVLQPFARAEPSRNRAGGGAGLGLALTATVAQRHGGGLTLTPRAGGGLLVHMTLPTDSDSPA